MVITVSQVVILVIGIIICVLAAWGIYSPQGLVQRSREIMVKNWSIYFAVIVRLLLGLALIIAASVSRFPLVFLILGWVVIVAAVAAAFMGRERLRRFADWWLKQFSPLGIRVWLLFAIAFGGFLIYGVS